MYSAGRVPSQQAVTAGGLCEQDYVIECVKAGLRARATCHRACRLRFDRISAVICAPRWVKRYLCTVSRSVSVLPVGPSCIIGATLIPPPMVLNPLRITFYHRVWIPRRCQHTTYVERARAREKNATPESDAIFYTRLVLIHTSSPDEECTCHVY